MRQKRKTVNTQAANFDKCLAAWVADWTEEAMLGKLGIHMQKNESQPLSLTSHRNQLNLDLNVSIRAKVIKVLEGKKIERHRTLKWARIFFNSLKHRKWAKVTYRIPVSQQAPMQQTEQSPGWRDSLKWERVPISYLCDKRSMSRLYKTLEKLKSENVQ